jgi:hypothetical protein
VLYDGCFPGAAAATALKSWDRARGSCTGGVASSASAFRAGWLLQRRWISCKGVTPMKCDCAAVQGNLLLELHVRRQTACFRSHEDHLHNLPRRRHAERDSADQQQQELRQLRPCRHDSRGQMLTVSQLLAAAALEQEHLCA